MDFDKKIPKEGNKIKNILGLVAILLIAAIVYFGLIIQLNKGNVGVETIQNSMQNDLEYGKYVLNSTTNTSNQQNKNTQINNQTNSLQTTNISCKNNAVYFIYADWCPHCQKMKPWVQQLESENYQLVRIDSQNQDAVKTTKTCLSGIAQFKYIPEFVCPATKESHVGEFASIDEMRQFIAKCNAYQ